MSTNTQSNLREVVDLAAHGIEKQVQNAIKSFKSLASHEISHKDLNFRQAAADKLNQYGLPNTRMEDWKYTDLQSMLHQNFTLADLDHKNNNYSQDVLDKIRDYINSNYLKLGLNSKSDPDSDSDLISDSIVVLLDGLFRADLSVLSEMSCVNSLYNGFDSQLDIQFCATDTVTDEVKQSSRISQNAINNLVNACWLDGVNISLDKKDTSSTHNIILLNIFTKHGYAKIINTKNIIHVGSNKNIDLTEEYLCLDGNDNFILNTTDLSGNSQSYQGSNNAGDAQTINPGLCFNSIFDIKLESGAKLRHYILQNQSQSNYHITTYNIQQETCSEYYNYNINLGSKLSRQNINIIQAQENAASELNGLYMPKKTQHMDTQLKVLHNSSHGVSKQDYRGVLSERGHGVFNGLVYVENNTVDNNAAQSNKNILLSKHCEIDTKPELQIYADDVVCSHGATIGKLDKDALFYLQSRGIDKKLAKGILVSAFIRHVTDKITNLHVTKWLESRLEAQLDYIANKIS